MPGEIKIDIKAPPRPAPKEGSFAAKREQFARKTIGVAEKTGKFIATKTAQLRALRHKGARANNPIVAQGEGLNALRAVAGGGEPATNPSAARPETSSGVTKSASTPMEEGAGVMTADKATEPTSLVTSATSSSETPGAAPVKPGQQDAQQATVETAVSSTSDPAALTNDAYNQRAAKDQGAVDIELKTRFEQIKNMQISDTERGTQEVNVLRGMSEQNINRLRELAEGGDEQIKAVLDRAQANPDVKRQLDTARANADLLKTIGEQGVQQREARDQVIQSQQNSERATTILNEIANPAKSSSEGQTQEVTEIPPLAAARERDAWRKSVQGNDEYAAYNAYRDGKKPSKDVVEEVRQSEAYKNAEPSKQGEMITQAKAAERAKAADAFVQERLTANDPLLNEMAKHDPDVAAALKRTVATQQENQQVSAIKKKLDQNSDYTKFRAQKEMLTQIAEAAQQQKEAGAITEEELTVQMHDVAEKIEKFQLEFIKQRITTPDGKKLLEDIAQVDDDFRGALELVKVQQQEAETTAEDESKLTPLERKKNKLDRVEQSMQGKLDEISEKKNSLKKEDIQRVRDLRSQVEAMEAVLPELKLQAMDDADIISEVRGKNDEGLGSVYSKPNILHVVKRRKRNVVLREAEKMHNSFAKLAAQGELPEEVRKLLEDAHGNEIRIKDKYKDDMGYILRKMRIAKGSKLKRIPIVGRFFKNTQKQEIEIAELQLKALTGQLKDEDLDKYNKGFLKFLWNTLGVVIAITAPVAMDTAKDSFAAQNQQ